MPLPFPLPLAPSSREIRKSRVMSLRPQQQQQQQSSPRTEIIFGGIDTDDDDDNNNNKNDIDDDEESIGFFSPTTGRSTIASSSKVKIRSNSNGKGTSNNKNKTSSSSSSSSSLSNLVSMPPDLFPLTTDDDDGYDDKNQNKNKTTPEAAFHSSFASASLTPSQFSGWSHDTDFDDDDGHDHGDGDDGDDNNTIDNGLDSSSRLSQKGRDGHGSFASRSHTLRKGKKSTFTSSNDKKSNGSSCNGSRSSIRSIGSKSKSKSRSERLGGRSTDTDTTNRSKKNLAGDTDYHNHTTRSHRTTGSLSSLGDENIFLTDRDHDHKNSSGRGDGESVPDLHRSFSSVSSFSSDRGNRRHRHHHRHHPSTTDSSKTNIRSGNRSSSTEGGGGGDSSSRRDSSSQRTKHSGRKVDKFLSASEIDDLIGHCLTPEMKTCRKTIVDEHTTTATTAATPPRSEAMSRPRSLSSKSNRLSSRNVFASTAVDDFPESLTDSSSKNKKGKLCVKPTRCKIQTSADQEFMKDEMFDSGFIHTHSTPPPPPTTSSGFDDDIGFGDDGDDAFASPIVHNNKKIPMSPIRTGSVGLGTKVASVSRKKKSMVVSDRGRPPKQSMMVVVDKGSKKNASGRTGISHTSNSSLQSFSHYEDNNDDLFASRSSISSDIPHHHQQQQHPKLSGHYELRRSTMSTIRKKDAKQRKSQVLDSLSSFA